MRLWRDLLWNPRVLIPTVVPGKFLYAFWRDLLWNNFAFDEVNVQVVVRFLYAFWRDLLWNERRSYKGGDYVDVSIRLLA